MKTKPFRTVASVAFATALLALFFSAAVPVVPHAAPVAAEPVVTGPVATVFEYPDGRRLRMFVQRDPESDVRLDVQTATAPDGPWATVAFSTPGKPFEGPGYVGGDTMTPGIKTVEVRDTVNAEEGTKRFMRVRVRGK